MPVTEDLRAKVLDIFHQNKMATDEELAIKIAAALAVQPVEGAKRGALAAEMRAGPYYDKDGKPRSFVERSRLWEQAAEALSRTCQPSPTPAPVQQAPAWQPIETAPDWKDEDDLLLLFEPHDMGGFMFIGGRNPQTGAWFNNMDGVQQNPTHWMPAPKRPALPSSSGDA